MSILARNRHPIGRGGKMLEETVIEYSFLRQCIEIIFALSLGIASTPQSLIETQTGEQTAEAYENAYY